MAPLSIINSNPSIRDPTQTAQQRPVSKRPPLVAADSSASEPCTLLVRWISQVNGLHIDQTKRIPTAAVFQNLGLSEENTPEKCWSQIMKVLERWCSFSNGWFSSSNLCRFLGESQKSLDVNSYEWWRILCWKEMDPKCNCPEKLPGFQHD